MKGNLKIRGKILSGTMAIVVLLIATTTIAYVALTRVGTSADQIQDHSTQLEQTGAIQLAVTNLQMPVNDYLITGESGEIAKFDARYAEAVKAVDTLRMNADISAEEKQLLDRVSEQLGVMRDKSKDLFRVKVAAQNRGSAEIMKEIDATSDRLVSDLDRLHESNKRDSDAAMATADATESYSKGLLLATAVLAVMLGIVIGVVLATKISRPLAEMTAVSGRIAQGDLDQTITVRRGDEIGQLADSFREMIAYMKGMAGAADRIAGGDLREEVKPKSAADTLGNAFWRMIGGLRGIITEIRAGSDQTSTAAAEIASSAEQSARNNESAATAVEEVTSSIHEMAANIQNVAKNTQGQASAVTQTSASIEQLVASIQRIAATTKQLVELSQRAKTAVEHGLEAVDKSIRGTDEISKAIGRSADTISALGSRATDIGKIVNVIDDIAEQTNLLALNAAIEAARAGDQGLGFAVVAEEVRKLAERSAQSTREISELILGIQREAQDAVALMDKVTQTVESGVALSRQVGSSLQGIEGNVREVDRFSREIGAATQEQSAGSTQIGKAAESLRETTREIQSATDEQASAAEQIVKTMEKMREMVQQNASATTQLASSAEEMNAQSERFQQVVGTFVVDTSVPALPDAAPKAKNGGKVPRRVLTATAGKAA